MGCTWRIRLRGAVGALGALAVLGTGCVDVSGGAVEFPWAIFARDGRAITDCACADPPIAYVALALVSEADGSDPCAFAASCRFTCGRKIGATPFFIPPGSYQMSIVPMDGTLNVLPTVDTVPPVVREVARGQPTELDAFMLTASCADRCNGGSPTQPCSGG